jgi:hypothetical protein
MSIGRNERSLIVINYLASGNTDYLYRFIEASGRSTVAATLGDDYAKLTKLYGKNATLAKLINALRVEGAKRGIKRIDLIVMLHGQPGQIVFYDGSRASSDIKTEIRALNIQSKLRLVYSTCCYGDSHSRDFIAAGFDAAIGSKKVNANAAVEFGPLLGLWQFNVKLSDCLAPTIPPTPAADAAAKAFGRAAGHSWWDDVNSRKVLRFRSGISNIKISS